MLKETWSLGRVDAQTYRRAIDVPNLRGSVLPSGRALEAEELAALFEVCAGEDTAAGRRDAAMLAVFYGTGLRCGELAGLDLGDTACSLRFEPTRMTGWPAMSHQEQG